ncbi:MAG: tetratricopeptide repeat protein [Gammaproteobacteria bacterium]
MIRKLFCLVVFASVLSANGVCRAADAPVPAPTTQAPIAGSQNAAAQAVAASGEARALAGAGASQLAIKLIDASQPPFPQAPAAWEAWERARLDILSAANDDSALYAQIHALPDKVSSALRTYAYQVGAGAALGADNPARARGFLRRLIWSQTTPTPAALAGYRQLVLRSYVVGGQLDDAERALNYLQRSGYAKDRHTRETAAEVALESGKPRQAVHLLSGIKQPEVRPLMLLAELKAGIHTPRKVADLAEKLARAAEKHKDLQTAGRFERVRAAAAVRDKNSEVQLAALAVALSLNPYDAGPFQVTPAQLWKTWVNTGLQLGNSRQLLLGDAQPWMSAAAAENKAKRPMLALALLAAAGTRSPDASARGACLAAFAQQLMARPRGIPLALTLFSDPHLFPEPGNLPGALRYKLLEPAVSTGRIGFASAMVAGLDTPPAGGDPGDWQLQRARLLLLGGDSESGIKVLFALAHGNPAVPAKKLLPVVVDLETLGDNRAALGVLEDMLAGQPAPPPEQARQILYWIGKAYSGLDSPLNAARSYLEAATFNSPYAMDPWAQTARYSAASALTAAGLYGDAQRIYEALLNATSDPTQQAQIKQKLAAVRTLANRASEKSADGNR